jgi:hypothetical protein
MSSNFKIGERVFVSKQAINRNFSFLNAEGIYTILQFQIEGKYAKVHEFGGSLIATEDLIPEEIYNSPLYQAML